MNCRGVIEELSSYFDDDLDPQVTADLERHLHGCRKCRVIVDTTRKTIEIYCNAEPVPLPEDVRQRLHNALRDRLGHKAS